MSNERYLCVGVYGEFLLQQHGKQIFITYYTGLGPKTHHFSAPNTKKMLDKLGENTATELNMK